MNDPWSFFILEILFQLCKYCIDHAWVIIAIAQLIERRRLRLLTMRRRREPVVIIRLTHERELVAAHPSHLVYRPPTILSCIDQNLAKFASSLSLCVDAQYLYSLCVDSQNFLNDQWLLCSVAERPSEERVAGSTRRTPRGTCPPTKSWSSQTTHRSAPLWHQVLQVFITCSAHWCSHQQQ